MTDTEKKLAFLLATSPNLVLAWDCSYEEAAKDLAANGVALVRHGRWVGGYHTSKGRWVYTKPCCSLCSFEQEGTSNYCPNCGAKMRGDTDE